MAHMYRIRVSMRKRVSTHQMGHIAQIVVPQGSIMRYVAVALIPPSASPQESIRVGATKGNCSGVRSLWDALDRHSPHIDALRRWIWTKPIHRSQDR